MGAYVFILVPILIVCVLLTLIVLVQNSKGGGLASNFSSSNQIMGVRKTTDFLEKTTWTLAVLLLVLSLGSIFVIPRNVGANTKANNLQEQVKELQIPAQTPVTTPTPAPTENKQ